MSASDRYDVLVVGGGPAGLSAALVLGRCRRRVLVVDAGHPRNERSPVAHGLFTRDGTPPSELLRIGREQLAPYDVRVVDDAVVGVKAADGAFLATTASRREIRARKLLIATGMRDVLPEIPGIDALFGSSVFVCPYCDGWEHRDQRLCSYVSARSAVEVALGLTTWSADVVAIVPDGPLAREDGERLARNGVVLHEDRIDLLEASQGDLAAIRLASGARIERDALFVHLGEVQASTLAERLGCPFEETGTVAAGLGERAGPPGVFVAGDASHDRQLVAIAVAEGVKAACAINADLRLESER
jgi:thioredoxin reductase